MSQKLPTAVKRDLATPSRLRTEGVAAHHDFFIPDLCATRPTVLSILLAELVVLVHVLASSGLPSFGWQGFAMSSLFVLWVVLLSNMLLCWCRRPFSRLSLPLATTASLAIVTLVTLVTSLVVMEFFAHLVNIQDGHWWIVRNLLVAIVLAGIVLRYFYLQQQLRLQEQLELHARLESLQTRIRPHFLFNTLNSIASLIVSRPETAEKAVEDLAELFRSSLKESRDPTTVEDEIRLTRLYLGIEELRLGSRLQVHWDVEDRTLGASMPTLVLQPLVENAVYHGISRMPNGGKIDIRIAREGDALVVSVDNPVPEARTASKGNKMALANVTQRLRAIYGPGATLAVFPGADHFRVELAYTPTFQ
jgi:two-component system, LytTR family, sensor histidine kinase AlgZ